MTFTPAWYAIQVRGSAEHFVASVLSHKGYDVFLPVHNHSRGSHSSPRRCLYPGYLFARCIPDITERIVTTSGVIRLVGVGANPERVPDSEIENLRRVVESRTGVQPWKYLPVGTRVRIEDGPLKEVEGIIVHDRDCRRLLISISILQRSVAVALDKSTSFAVLSSRLEPQSSTDIAQATFTERKTCFGRA